uniref:ATP synthase subunit a n=1 Tax=Pambolus sp. QL-2013 TaxID=1421597 RepID=A0A0A6ZL76_9HYME|nr:ATP synthase F0 subunit 6 [Pambolus sp. QL-2013]
MMMMLNLFSVFDPYSLELFYIYMNWYYSFLWILILPLMYWMIISRFNYFFYKFFYMLYNEFKVLLVNKKYLYDYLFMISLFFFMLINNFMGLFSYVFTSSSHLIFSFFFSFIFWFMSFFSGWYNNMLNMFAHLVPQGTPMMLMVFMVLIESLSMMIRPMTLCIRLSANMIAGHLLLTLLGNSIPMLLLYLIVLLIQLMLLLLEVAVSIIQSYVFVLLLILYYKEIE